MDFGIYSELTLQNSNSATDFSIDEHHFTAIQTNCGNLACIPLLRHEKPVILFTATGKKLPATVSLSENYENLQIFVKRNMKLISSKEIKEISQSFIIQVEREDDNLFPVRVKTKCKQYLFAFFNKELRTDWCDWLNSLLKCIVAYQSQEVLKVFCELVSRSQEISNRVSQYAENCANNENQIRSVEKSIKKIEKSTIKHLLNDLITRVESKLHEKKIEEVNFQIANLESEKTLLLKNQEILLRSMQKKEEESELLRETLYWYRNEFVKLSKVYSTRRLSRQIWVNIFPFFTFKDLLIVSGVNKALHRSVSYYLTLKYSWQVFSRFSLTPRATSWPYFFSAFYREIFPVPNIKLTKSQCFRNYPGLVSAVCTLDAEVQEVCLLLCEGFKIVSCFEELGKVANYVFFVLKNSKKVFEVLYSLVNPPYYLLEIWKPGLLRLRLGIFQAQKLLKLRHPHLFWHFKQIDLSLDYILTPWIGSLFTCYFSPSEPNEALSRIWDLFILNGWNGLITCCLALLFNSQEKVIGESLENTMKYYRKTIESKEVIDVLGKYSVESSLLNELERSFYFYIEN